MNPTTDSTVEPCGLLRRGLCILYDAMVVVALWILAAALALPLTSGDVQAGRDPLYTAYLLLWWLAYICICWSWAGQTLGMRAWKIQLVDDQDQAPRWSVCLARFFAAWGSAIPAGFGFLASLWHPQRLAWHDRLTQTRLIRTDETSH